MQRPAKPPWAPNRNSRRPVSPNRDKVTLEPSHLAPSSGRSMVGSQHDSNNHRPIAERVTSGPEALITGMIPSQFHRPEASPSMRASLPEMPPSTRAFHAKPRA